MCSTSRGRPSHPAGWVREAAPADLAALPRLAPPPQRVETYRPERFEVTFRALASGWIVVADRWAPGWRATLDGRPVELLGANFLLRAIAVEAGEQRLAMSYRPAGHPWAAAALSWTLLAALTALAVAAGGAGRTATTAAPAWLLYDGTCGLCDRSVQWLLRRDRRGALRFARLERAAVEERWRFLD